MQITLPSHEVYSIDVPEIKEFDANFIYNYFVKDESVSETGGIPKKLLTKNSEVFDSEYIHYATIKSPRLVVFSFTRPTAASPDGVTNDVDVRQNNSQTHSTIVSDNLDKIVTEDHFASQNFIAVTFNDHEVDDKVYYLTSGSIQQHMSYENSDDIELTPLESTRKLAERLSDLVDQKFLLKSMTSPARKSGARHFTAVGTRITNAFFNRLRMVSVNVQINQNVFNDLLDRTISDPYSQYTTELRDINVLARNLKTTSIKRRTSIDDSDYRVNVPFISANIKSALMDVASRRAVIVGYVIDKIELLPNGSSKQHQPIVINSPTACIAIDPKVKYNTTYVYSIRTITQFTVPAVEDESGAVALIKMLVSSKPSKRLTVKTIETKSPPPPTDVSFTWDYERKRFSDVDSAVDESVTEPGSLLVHWTFPPNSQRDIKAFQVFRRSTVDEPFQLIRMYQFDDSVVKLRWAETPDKDLVEIVDSPLTFYFDDEFGKDSRFIYSIVAIDAHGISSAYSAQYEIWFDRFANKLRRRLISHLGAPKSYPNLYLDADLFVDTMKVSGAFSKKLKIYFNPECYEIIDEMDRKQKMLSTKQDGGAYKFQFINVDNMKSDVINLTLNDVRRSQRHSEENIIQRKKNL
jgi:hypothetical protein